jgi:hypothetical protein
VGIACVLKNLLQEAHVVFVIVDKENPRVEDF